MIENIEKMRDNIHKQMDESGVQMEKHMMLLSELQIGIDNVVNEA